MTLDKLKLEELCSENLSLSKISKHFGCRVSTVKKYLIECQIDRNHLKNGPHKGKHRNKICPICHEVFDDTHKNNKAYCSRKCLKEQYYNDYINRWINGLEDGMSGMSGISPYIRRYLFEKYNNKCQDCGWSKVHPITEKIPLTINHVDGNFRNNNLQNLQLLCPNCHSLTHNFGSLNKGKGRPSRNKLRLCSTIYG